jgi:hypothetical protein
VEAALVVLASYKCCTVYGVQHTFLFHTFFHKGSL